MFPPKKDDTIVFILAFARNDLGNVISPTKTNKSLKWYW
jgi:hypothetical protein